MEKQPSPIGADLGVLDIVGLSKQELAELAGVSPSVNWPEPDRPELTPKLSHADLDVVEPRPLNRRQRRFAGALAKGLEPVEAYMIAGFYPHRANCLRLARDARIIAEVDRIKRSPRRAAQQQFELALGKAMAASLRKAASNDTGRETPR